MKVTNDFWKLWLYIKTLYRVRRTKLYFIAICLASATLYCLLSRKLYDIKIDINHTKLFIQMRLHDSILNEKGAGCEVPRLDPFSEEAIKDDYDQSKVKCEGKDWVQCHISKCYVIEEVLKKMKEIYCIYKDILYINDNEYDIGEPVKLFGNEIYTLNKSDHVKVACTGMEIGAILPSLWFGLKIGFRDSIMTRTHKHTKRPSSHCNNLNVMILCFHSASRNRFTRRMPKSLKVLTEELNATVFNIHNIVGDGTAAALFPLMTGKSEVELSDARKGASQEFMDVKNCIFYTAKQSGFRTAFLEDVEYVGTFQNRYNGFSQQPADHYLRAFHLEAIKNSKWLTGFRNRHCIGSTPLHKKILDLTQQFSKSEGKYISFSLIGQIYHDEYNLVSTVDDYVVTFLRDLEQSGALENTLLMVLGDHGPRFGRFRDTYQGKLEERLPLMALVLPKRVKQCQPTIAAVVAANSGVLTTHFDVYATALDALGLQEHTSSFMVRGANIPRAMSLLKPIPKNRTCGEAGVLPHWCVCSKWVDVPKLNPMHIQVANILAEFINNLTATVRNDCAMRNLISVVWVMRQSLNEEVLRYGGEGDSVLKYSEGFGGNLPRPIKEYYQAKIKMGPGVAVYEGTVTYAVGDGGCSALRVLEISRVNAYGDESACMKDTHPELEQYCYCNRKHRYTFSYKTFNIK